MQLFELKKMFFFIK